MHLPAMTLVRQVDDDCRRHDRAEHQRKRGMVGRGVVQADAIRQRTVPVPVEHPADRRLEKHAAHQRSHVAEAGGRSDQA